MCVTQFVLPDNMCVPASPCTGPATVGTPCDDLNEGTVNDECQADGSCMGVAPCVNPCDDGNPQTANDQWQEDNTCVGALLNPLFTSISHVPGDVGVGFLKYVRS